ncbi:hypothetical protein [Deinococcus peraridilitoris]|nr:hypothetical protein [Deinococcus peraridilitoris]
METPKFVDLSAPLHEVLPYLQQHDFVLVGTKERLVGILTASDVMTYLYSVAVPFLLVQEIELALRDLIQKSVVPDILAECSRRALSSLYREDRLPITLEAMSFGDYVTIIKAPLNWPHFSGALGADRNRASVKLEPIGGLRNDVFHFKRPITSEDTERLSACRDWLKMRLELIEDRSAA